MTTRRAPSTGRTLALGTLIVLSLDLLVALTAVLLAGRPFGVGLATALAGSAIHLLPLLLAWAVLLPLSRIPVPLLGFAVAQGVKVTLVLVGLVAAALVLKSEPGPFAAKDLVWVVAGFASALASYFFVMRKS